MSGIWFKTCRRLTKKLGVLSESHKKTLKRRYDVRILERPYKQGDIVYLLDTTSVKGKCKKLLPPWKGPAVVTKKISSAVVTANNDRMKPCRDRILPNWIVNFLRQPIGNEEQGEKDSNIYCFCKKIWDNQFMIQCDYCQEWYHGKCVDITPTEALNTGKYRCSPCR